jgi:hypothetical protein
MYNGIVEEYKQEAYGIFDETPDLHRSIVWSDAYYGDTSSVLALYRDTGKPMMIINIKCLPDSKYRLAPSFIYKENNTLWASPDGIDILLKASGEDQEFNYTGKLTDKLLNQLDSFFSYTQPIEHKGILYFSHYYTNVITLYDKKNASFEKITLKSYDTLYPDSVSRNSEAQYCY